MRLRTRTEGRKAEGRGAGLRGRAQQLGVRLRGCEAGECALLAVGMRWALRNAPCIEALGAVRTIFKHSQLHI